MKILSRVLLLSLLLTCGVARADGPPVLRSLDRRTAPPGTVVIVTGRNFVPGKIEVKVDGKSCLVTEATETQVMIVTPMDAKLGSCKLVLTCKGESAEIEIEIIDPKKLGKRNDQSQDSVKHLSKLIVTESLKVESLDGGGFQVRVTGKTVGMVDGLRVGLELKFGKKLLKSGTVEVKGNRFNDILGPFKGDLFPGSYTVAASFQIGRQARRVRRKWLKSLSSEQKQNYQNISRIDYFPIGSEESMRSKATEQRKAYQRLLGQLDKLIADADAVFAATALSFFRKGRKVDEAKWRAWLLDKHYVKDSKEADALKRKGFVRSGYLDDDRWMGDLEEKLEVIREARKKVKSVSSRYLTPRYPKTVESIEKILSVLADLMLRRTGDLFERSELERPSESEIKREARLTDLPHASRASRANYRVLRLRCARELDPLGAPRGEGAGE